MSYIQAFVALGVTLLFSSPGPRFSYVAARPESPLEEIDDDVEKDMMEHVSQHVQLEFVRKDWLPSTVEFEENEGMLETTKLPYKEAKEIIYNYNVVDFHSKLLSESLQLFTDSQYGYNASLDTFIIVNPPAGDPHGIAYPTIAAMALRNMLKYYNVFSVNAGEFMEIMGKVVIFTAVGKSGKFQPFAAAIGSAFEDAVAQGLLKPQQINLMGFSYSSQLCGYVARHIAEKCGQKINSILGLEPYSVGLSSISRTPLNAGDADIVHIFHTDSLGFGTYFRHGSANFVFNRNHFQPGSKKSNNGMYSHEKAARYAWMMIIYKGIFVGRECSNHFFFEICACDKKDYATITFPLDGNIHGDFYLNTNRKGPYGLGMEGASCSTKNAGYDE